MVGAMDMKSNSRVLRSAAAILVMIAPTACGLLGGRSLEGSLREFVVASWAKKGVHFMGRYGSGPIATVTAQSPDIWSVVYPDDDVVGGSVTGDVRITSLEAYPIFRGEEFAEHLHETASGINRRGGLTQDARTAVQNGDYEAIGLVRVEVTLSSRSGREIVEQLAVLPSGSGWFGGEWVFRDEDRKLGSLLHSTRILFDDMIRNDDGVRNCAHGVDPAKDMQPSLECATIILGREFGG